MHVTIGIVGSINLDLVAYGERLPKPGETLTGARFAQYPGGKGANQALAARRLGAHVCMAGCIGSDALAESALTLLNRDGVDTSCVTTQTEKATGVALINVSDDGENQIMVASGANTCLNSQDIAALPSCQVILSQLEIPLNAVDAAARLARQQKALFALNLAPAIAIPDSLLCNADLLIANEGEAAFFGTALHQGKGMVAITYGAAGAALYRNGREIARVPAFKVPVVDTTGAGDAFCGALAVALAEGQSEVKALQFATATAGLAVTAQGAQTSLPDRAAVQALLTQGL